MAAKDMRHFGEAVVLEGEIRAVPDLSIYTQAFDFQLRKNHGKTSVRGTEKCQLGTIRFYQSGNSGCRDRLLPLLIVSCVSGGCIYPFVSVNICRVAELKNSPHQLALSRNSQSGL